MAEIKTREPSGLLRRRSADASSNSSSSYSLLNRNMQTTIYYLDLNYLIPFKNQARKFFDEKEIQSLADSIKQYGIRQPLTVVKSTTNENLLEVVSGERRLRAAKLIGMDKVPCIILEDYKQAEKVALIENIQRADLHPIELGDAYQQILSDNNITKEMLAKEMAVPRTQISEFVSFANIHYNVKQALISNKITQRAVLRKVLKLKNEKEQLTFIDSILRMNVKVISQDTKIKKLILVQFNNDSFVINEKEIFRLSSTSLKVFLKELKDLEARIEKALN